MYVCVCVRGARVRVRSPACVRLGTTSVVQRTCNGVTQQGAPRTRRWGYTSSPGDVTEEEEEEEDEKTPPSLRYLHDIDNISGIKIRSLQLTCDASLGRVHLRKGQTHGVPESISHLGLMRNNTVFLEHLPGVSLDSQL